MENDLSASRAEAQARLIRSLTDPALYGASCTAVRVIETHISYVLLTGRHAYKIKKPVNLGFLDFTTLPARHLYCERELELNRRFAPTIYLEVVAITGTPDSPRVGGDGTAIEYAVKMLEFSQDGLLASLLAQGALTAGQVDALAAEVAAFHASAAAARTGSLFGSADAALALAVENFTEIEPLLVEDLDRRSVAALREWTGREHAARASLFTARQRDGFVRECHGDLHLGNIALIDGRPTMFDCIEFNETMRWSDVMADVGFLVMDLQDRGRSDWASRFLNGYLERTGDYDGLRVLRFYVVYRAMVRAKVACMRASQTMDGDDTRAKIAEYREYLSLASRCSASASRGIVITHGFAGSGKTALTGGLIELAGAIRIRTDVERKRLCGLEPLARSGSGLNSGLYGASDTERTYGTIERLARTNVEAGYLTVIDGTFLRRSHRDRIRTLAADLHVPFVIVDVVARIETLRERVLNRHRLGRDASDADTSVLEYQLRTAQPIAEDERDATVTYDAEAPIASAWNMKSWQPVLQRLHGHGPPAGCHLPSALREGA